MPSIRPVSPNSPIDLSLLRRRRPGPATYYVFASRPSILLPLLLDVGQFTRHGRHGDGATAACNCVLAYIGSDAWRDAGFEGVFWYMRLKGTILLTINDVGGPLGRWMILPESLRLRGGGGWYSMYILRILNLANYALVSVYKFGHIYTYEHHLWK